MRSAVAPLVLAWLAAHAVLLGLFLVLKFLGAKTLLVIVLLLTAVWYLTGHRQQPLLSAPR